MGPLVALLLAGSVVSPPGGLYSSTAFSRVRLPGGTSPIVFAFSAPAAGAYASITPTVGGAISCTRASSGTYQTSATTIATAAANTCRVDYRGLTGEANKTNYVLQSKDVSNAAWTKNGTPVVTANTGVYADGTTTMGTIDITASASAGDSLSQSVAVTSSTGPFVVRSWIRPVGASNVGGVGLSCSAGNATACSCAVSSGTCTAGISGNTCESYTTATGLVQMTVTGSCTVANTSVTPFVQGGSYVASIKDKAQFGGVQFEVTPPPTSNIDTTTTATARSADVIDEGARTLSATPSMSATVALEGLPASGTAVALDATDGTNTWKLAINPSGTVTCTYGAGSDTTVGTVPVGTATLVACSYDGTTLKACVAGTCHGTVVALSPVSAFTHLYVGSDGAANFANGFLSQACAGKTAGACPP